MLWLIQQKGTCKSTPDLDHMYINAAHRPATESHHLLTWVELHLFCKHHCRLFFFFWTPRVRKMGNQKTERTWFKCLYSLEASQDRRYTWSELLLWKAVYTSLPVRNYNNKKHNKTKYYFNQETGIRRINLIQMLSA